MPIITITILVIDLPEGDDLRALISVLPLAVCYPISFIMVLSYVLLERAIIHSSGCAMLWVAVSKNRKARWVLCVEAVVLGLPFIPGAHYAACPRLLVAMAPWIIPDLRMKRVFDQVRRMTDATEGDQN